MKKFEFTAFINNTGYWTVTGTIMAENEENATFKLMNEDFNNDDVEFQQDDEIINMSLEENNARLLFLTLEKIKTLNSIELIHNLIKTTLNNLVSPITIDDLTELVD